MSSDLVIQVGHSHVYLLKGDITQIAVDAIVNAANPSLLGGRGVDGAIHRVGGPSLMGELDKLRARIGSCPAGKAVVTGAGYLPARYVFHAVGPRYREGMHQENEQLASCYSTCLDLAAERQLESISFPSISTGAYGFPIEAATKIALKTVIAWLQAHSSSVKSVKLVQFSDPDHAVYREVLRSLHDPADGVLSS